MTNNKDKTASSDMSYQRPRRIDPKPKLFDNLLRMPGLVADIYSPKLTPNSVYSINKPYKKAKRNNDLSCFQKSTLASNSIYSHQQTLELKGPKKYRIPNLHHYTQETDKSPSQRSTTLGN